MPRTIQIDDDALHIRSSGLIRFFFVGQVTLPYAEIQSVEAGLHELPGMSRQVRRRVNKGKIIRGRFRDGDRRWYLFDFRHRDRAVTIVTVPGYRYSALYLEPEGDPEAFAAELRSRL